MAAQGSRVSQRRAPSQTRRLEVDPRVRSLINGGKYGLALWCESEIRHCDRHLRRVGQPLCPETAELWLSRRAAGRCPISDSCRRPSPGQIFCPDHSRYNIGPKAC